jgi:tetratricopeptide (TPR) repeat protein
MLSFSGMLFIALLFGVILMIAYWAWNRQKRNESLRAQAPIRLPANANGKLQAILAQVHDLYTRAVVLGLSSGHHDENVRQLLEQAQTALIQAPESPIIHLWRAKMHLELGRWFQAQKEKRLALDHFETAQHEAEEALFQGLTLSETFRVLSDALMQQIPFKNRDFAIEAGPRAKDAIQKALKLDPSNPHAYLSLGTYYLFTPIQYGGDLNKAINLFQKADEVATEVSDRFLAKVYTGLALKAKGQLNAAQIVFNEALAIYPNNAWVQRELKDLLEIKTK